MLTRYIRGQNNLMKIVGIMLFSGSILISACAKEAQVGSENLDWLKTKTLESLVRVEGGTFLMGDIGYVDETGQKHYFTAIHTDAANRDVTLSTYFIQRYEVTFSEFDMFIRMTGQKEVNPKLRGKAEHAKPEYPAYAMTWFQARDYCQWVGNLIGLSMDLPTEAQWEYAARSRGKVVVYATDNGKYEPGRNIRDAKINPWQLPPGTWPPNPLGIYDMTGNVDEWTRDWYISAYPMEDETNPTGPSEEQVNKYFLTEKVTRGGGIIGGAPQKQLYLRVSVDPNRTGAGVGLRCVANESKKLKKPGG